MHRESMIDQLVLDCFDKLTQSSRGIWLLSILRDGFVGFASMSDAQLAQEFARRGLGIDEEPAIGSDDWNCADGIEAWSSLAEGAAGMTGYFEN